MCLLCRLFDPEYGCNKCANIVHAVRREECYNRTEHGVAYSVKYTNESKCVYTNHGCDDTLVRYRQPLSESCRNLDEDDDYTIDFAYYFPANETTDDTANGDDITLPPFYYADLVVDDDSVFYYMVENNRGLYERYFAVSGEGGVC